jgi:hypothetical protein
MNKAIRVLALAAIAITAVSCRSVYYDTMERFGVQKRHILRDRVADGQREQREAQEQFQDAYEEFKRATGYDGGDLEGVYQKLSGELERSEDKAEAVRDRITSIEQVASDLFEEWQAEIGQIGSASLRSSSERSLRDTRTRYSALIAAMKRAESRMDPVLSAFRDQVLFLKHNLNARAIASLEGSVSEIEDDVERLIREIDASIQEAESFLAKLED